MKAIRHLVLAVAGSVVMGMAASPASANPSAYSSIVAFGDSLSDNGNFAAISNTASGGLVTFPSLPFAYAPGRFSNGPVAVEYLANALGLGLFDYAVGGAKTGPAVMPGVSDNYVDESGGTALLGLPANTFNGTSVTKQVDKYLASTGGSADGNALYFIWAGPNDYFSLADQAATQELAAAYVGNAITHLQTSVTNLYNAGAHNFLIPNMPNLGATPLSLSLGLDFVTAATEISIAHNASLAALLSGLDASLTGARFFTTDIFQLTTDVGDNPGNFGFANATDECRLNAACTDSSKYVYWDDVHVTTAAHAAVAGAFAAALAPVPEAQTWAMLLAGLALLGLARRVRG